MINQYRKTFWLATPLLLLSACSSGSGGSWGARDRSISWSTGLADDSTPRVPGLTHGSISMVDLFAGDMGVVRIAIWSNGSSLSYSSGGGPGTGCSMEGTVQTESGEAVPFKFSTADGVRAEGAIGDQEYSFGVGAMFLLYSTADGVISKQLPVPLEALDSFDIFKQPKRDAFAAKWGVTDFFEEALSR